MSLPGTILSHHLFEELMAVEFLDFYADWCGPCIAMNPVIEELEKEYSGKLAVKKIDVDSDQVTASRFGVMSIPTYVVLKDGHEVERFIGATSKETIKDKINRHIS